VSSPVKSSNNNVQLILITLFLVKLNACTCPGLSEVLKEKMLGVLGSILNDLSSRRKNSLGISIILSQTYPKIFHYNSIKCCPDGVFEISKKYS
jgi:hypothetical protein